jgi:hypothetical protein
MARVVWMFSPETRNCTGKPHWRTVLEARDAAAKLREVGVEQREQARADLLAVLDALRRDDHLREVRLRELLVERQVEPRRAAPDVRHVALDALVGIERSLELLRCVHGRGKRASFRQAQVDEELHARGGREELLRDEAKEAERADEHDERDGNHGLAMANAPGDRFPQAGIERRRVDVVVRRNGRRQRPSGQLRPPAPHERRFVHRGTLRQHLVAEIGNDHDRDDPRRDERDSAHLEDRARVFAGRALAVAIGRKPATGDQRAGEHRERGARVGEARRAEAVEPLLELDRHHLDRDDRVVDEKPQREDERAERDLVQADVEQPHHEERDGEHERDRHGDHEPGAKTEAQKRHREHDDHGLGERAQELVDRALHGARHARDSRELDADGQRLLDARGLARQHVPELDHVAALDHRDADAERFLALEAHLLRRGVDVAARHLRDVAQAGTRGCSRGSRGRGSPRRCRRHRWAARRCGRSRCRTRPTAPRRSGARASR